MYYKDNLMNIKIRAVINTYLKNKTKNLVDSRKNFSIYCTLIQLVLNL
jgi:hypothetical protein